MSLPSFPQRGHAAAAIFDLPDNAPRKMQDVVRRIRFSGGMVRWFSLLRDQLNELNAAIAMVSARVPEKIEIGVEAGLPQSRAELNQLIESQVRTAIHNYDLSARRSDWIDFIMRESGGVVALEGIGSGFPGIRRSTTTPADTQSVLSDRSALTGHEVLDEAYDATNWNGKIEVPTKNAIRDIIESFPVFDHGTYTPTLTNVANLGASTAYSAQFLRVGSVVVVSGLVDVDPTAAGVSTQLGMSLPIASNFVNTQDCAGSASASGIAGQSAAIIADTGNDRAEMRWVSGDVTNQAMLYIYSYRIGA